MLHEVPDDVDEAVTVLEKVYQRAAACMKCEQREASNKKFNMFKCVWYDAECKDLSDQKYDALNRYRNDRSEQNWLEYQRKRNKYISLCRKKEERWKECEREKIEKAKNDPNKVWNLIKMKGRGNTQQNEIPPLEWFEYFKNLLNQESGTSTIDDQIEEDMGTHEQMCDECNVNEPKELNENIREDEIRTVIQKMANNKAPGVDGLVTELFKNSSDIVIPYLLKLFNNIMDKGQYPSEWCKAVICPLHQKGSKNVKDNYRGISLLDVCGKIFTKILNHRLYNWAEKLQKLHESQAGFRTARSTTDHLFTLQAVVQKYLSKKGGRFYTLFVDFSKAFDTVIHKYLWHRLINIGVHGKVLKVLQSMYSSLESCVRTPGGLTNFFNCCMGTRQGCMISPLLFILFINKLVVDLEEKGGQGIFISEECQNLLVLLFADDVLDLADTVGRLQRQISILEEYCDQSCMKINLTKTKIMVFRNGGFLRKNEKWFFKHEKIECVSYYKYLGLIISSRLSWSVATKTLASQAQKVIAMLQCFQYKYGKLPLSSIFHIFDRMIAPILLYGSEIWGYSYVDVIEKVHIRFCKHWLGIPKGSSDVAALGECGRYPLFVKYNLRCISYWCKILQMESHRYPKQCYNMLVELDNAGRCNWATHVKSLLFKFGFGVVWLSQEVGNFDLFKKILSQRLKDCAIQGWHESVTENKKLGTYCLFKSLLEPEKYLSLVKVSNFRIAITRFRCSSHGLHIETGRHKAVAKEERICLLCRKNHIYVIEDEFHFLMICPFYSELREKYLDKKYYIFPTKEKMINLIKSEKPEVLYWFKHILLKQLENRHGLYKFLLRRKKVKYMV